MKIISTKNNLISKVSELLKDARTQVLRNVNHTMVVTYFEIGRMIIEDEQSGKNRADYGKKVLKELSKHLTKEFGKGFSVDNLENMRRFYSVYSDRKVFAISETASRKSLPNSTLLQKSETPSRIFSFFLSWSHYLKLIKMEDPQERKFYEIESAQNNWSLRELNRQYDSGLYMRLALSRDKKGVLELSQKGQKLEKPEDAVKDPYILEFVGLPEETKYSESELEQKIIDKMTHFLLELGKGFTFVGRQVRFTFGYQHFRVDLVFYNRILKSFVLIDLKIGKLTHQDIGQMQMYVNYYDREIKLKDENSTIGIVLCQEKDKAVVEYTLPKNNKQIFASQYSTVLPKKQDLKKLLENK